MRMIGCAAGRADEAKGKVQFSCCFALPHRSSVGNLWWWLKRNEKSFLCCRWLGFLDEWKSFSLVLISTARLYIWDENRIISSSARSSCSQIFFILEFSSSFPFDTQTRPLALFYLIQIFLCVYFVRSSSTQPLSFHIHLAVSIWDDKLNCNGNWRWRMRRQV